MPDSCDLTDQYITELIPGTSVIEHVIVAPDVGCVIALDNPVGRSRSDRVSLPADERSLEGRIIDLPAHLSGERWLVVCLGHVDGQIIRGQPLKQWRRLWEDNSDFDVFRIDRTEYFE